MSLLRCSEQFEVEVSKMRFSSQSEAAALMTRLPLALDPGFGQHAASSSKWTRAQNNSNADHQNQTGRYGMVRRSNALSIRLPRAALLQTGSTSDSYQINHSPESSAYLVVRVLATYKILPQLCWRITKIRERHCCAAGGSSCAAFEEDSKHACFEQSLSSG